MLAVAGLVVMFEVGNQVVRARNVAFQARVAAVASGIFRKGGSIETLVALRADLQASLRPVYLRQILVAYASHAQDEVAAGAGDSHPA